MTKNARPSLNPANNGSLVGAIQTAFNKFMQGVSDMLPAKVVAFDRSSNRAQVQPLIALVTTNNEIVSRAQLASLPVMQLGGGGFVLSFNLKKNDLGWIKASDRDISTFLKYYKESSPPTARMHSFSDAIFIPDVMTGYNISGDDLENAVIQNLNGTVKISLGVEKIKISAPTIEIDSVTSVTINSQNATLVGNLNVIGNITATGSITPGV